MCINLSLILSHVPAPKAHTSQGTIHVFNWNDPAQPVPDPPDPLLQHHQACPGPNLLALPAPPGQLYHPTLPTMPPNQARHACRPGPPCPNLACHASLLGLPCPPTRHSMPADPARQASRPSQQTLGCPGQPCIFQLPAYQRQLAHFPLLLSKNASVSGDPSKNVAVAGMRIEHLCMHIAGGSELASEGAAEGLRCLNDGSALAGSWQGWQGVEGVRAQELALHAVHHERLDLPVSSLARQ